MVTKEQAREIYCRFDQIEDAEELIGKLEEFVGEELKKAKPSLSDPRYHPFGTIELHVPTFKEGKFDGSYRIFGISYSSAIKVLKNHVKHLKCELKELQKQVED